MTVAKVSILPLLLLSACAFGQDLEPRAYAVTPVGMNAVLAGYGFSSGDVIFDPSLPIEDVSADINSAVLGYYRSISLFGRSASIRAGVPYAAGHMRGLVAGEDTQIYRSGLADSRFQLVTNVFGAPAMTLKEFAKYRRSTTVWASFSASAPTGQYDPVRLINVGTNRWAFKPEVALSQVFKRWTVEGYLGVWLYTKNSRFQGNLVRRQSPLYTYQAHLSRNLKPGLWVAGDFTYYHGGAARTGPANSANFLRTTRMGITASFPVAKLQSIRVLYGATTYARIGGKFQGISVAYAYSWFD